MVVIIVLSFGHVKTSTFIIAFVNEPSWLPLGIHIPLVVSVIH